MEELSCRTCYMARRTRPDGLYYCEYYGIWVSETKGCMAYTPKA